MTDDVFGEGGSSAVTWKGLPLNQKVRLIVQGPAKLVQSRDFDTNEPAYWPAGADGVRNPKMSAVINVTQDGEERSLWAAKPSSLFSAIRDAQKAAGAVVATGGVLEVWITERQPHPTNPRMNDKNIFAASYTPGNAFADEPAAAPTAPVSAPPPASGGQVAELKAQIANLRKTGLTDAQILGTGMVKAVDGSPLDATSLAALDAVA